MLQGRLVPPQINNSMIEQVINKYDNILLDGYPRNLAQAEFLLSITKVKALIIIKIGEEETIKRLSKRVICTANNKIFIEDKLTNQEIQECESLGGKIIKREDDKPEAIKKRLEIYNNETQPIINFFKEKNISVLEIAGEKPISEVYNAINKEMKKL